MRPSPYDDLHPTVVHFHIFKNAGTSIDEIFRPFFGERYFSFDLDKPSARIGVARFGRFLQENPTCRYLTSHQIGMPTPVYEKRVVLPLVMLRDPFERVPSCFHFERDSQRRLGRDATLEGYLRGHLDSGMITATIGLQMLTLTDVRLLRDWRRESLDADAETLALRNLESLPAFGLVERFEESLRDMLGWLERFLPGVTGLSDRLGVRANVGRTPEEARGEARRYLADSLTAETYARLEEALGPELRLYDAARRRFEARRR